MSAKLSILRENFSKDINELLSVWIKEINNITHKTKTSHFNYLLSFKPGIKKFLKHHIHFCNTSIIVFAWFIEKYVVSKYIWKTDTIEIITLDRNLSYTNLPFFFFCKQWENEIFPLRTKC